MKGKRGLIMGLANERSLAWGIARAVAGEVHHVDAGYHVVGMKAEDAPDIATV